MASVAASIAQAIAPVLPEKDEEPIEDLGVPLSFESDANAIDNVTWANIEAQRGMSWIDKCDKERKELKQQREEAYRTQREMERAKAAVAAMEEETRKREEEEEKARSRRAAAAAKHTKQRQNKHQRALENQLEMEKQAKEKERREKLCRQAHCDKQQERRHKNAEAEAQERKMIRALGMVPAGANMTNEAKLELAKLKLKSLMATTRVDESIQEAGWTHEHWVAIIEQESEHVAQALLSDSLVKQAPEKQILEAQALAKSIAGNLAAASGNQALSADEDNA